MNVLWKISRWIFMLYYLISLIVDTKENVKIKGLLSSGNGFTSTSPKSSVLLPSSTSSLSPSGGFYANGGDLYLSDSNKNFGGSSIRKSHSLSSKLIDDNNNINGVGPGSGINLHYCEGSHEDIECFELSGNCLDCNFEKIKNNCRYGENVTVQCNVTGTIPCKGKRQFAREMKCQYCYQTPIWQQICQGGSGCNSIGAPRQYFKSNCTVIPELLCLGNRRFYRMLPCNWKNGYRWSTTFLLSITLGGFGADRFYLGRWQEGIGKLFSFGGLGLWTIVDIILIGVRYLGPADGSLYVD